MGEEDFSRLSADIRESGLREDIWTHQKQIIDGRNRYNACRAIGIQPRYREWDGNGSLISFVVSLNLHRRHLTESQRAMIAAKLANLGHGGKRQVADVQLAKENITRADAATMMNVSKRIVDAAAKVKDEGVVELTKAVERGDVTVAAAALVSELPAKEQKEILKGGADKVTREAAKIRSKKLGKKIKHARKFCLLCNTHIAVTEKNFLDHLEALRRRVPKFSRYVFSIMEEIENESGLDEAQTEYALILSGLDSGFNEFNQLRQYTGLQKDRLLYLLKLLVESGDVEQEKQGGKPDAARGQRKILFFHKERITH